MAFGDGRVYAVVKEILGITQGLRDKLTEVDQRTDRIKDDVQHLKLTTPSSNSTEQLRKDIANLKALVESYRAEAASARAEAEAARRASEESLRVQARAAADAAEARQADTAPEETPPPLVEQPAVSANTPSNESDHSKADRKEYEGLLLIAGRVSSAKCTIHRDLWAFLIEHAAAEQHFRVPGEVKELDEGRVEVALSGRSLIAAITAVWELRRSRRGRDDQVGDWALSNTLYQALRLSIQDASRSTQGPGGQRIAIDVDLLQGEPITEVSGEEASENKQE